MAITAFLVVASPPLAAWHGKGHMAVAAVAYQLLNPPIRDRVDNLPSHMECWEWKFHCRNAEMLA